MSTDLRVRLLGRARRLVVKLGSNLLAPEGRGVRPDRLRALADQVAALKRQGREIVIVSSGAIASGLRLLPAVRPTFGGRRSSGTRSRPRMRRSAAMVHQQALAAVGQPELMRAYAAAFHRRRLVVAQVLLTREDLLVPSRRDNARRTLLALLRYGVVPIVNENDTVAVDEIRMGENDMLSARVARLTGADALIILTDVDGLHDGHPARDARARRIDVVRGVTARIRRFAGPGAGSAVGTGGMRTKLDAAARLTRDGRPVLIARGTDRDVLVRAVRGDSLGTLFLPGNGRS